MAENSPALTTGPRGKPAKVNLVDMLADADAAPIVARLAREIEDARSASTKGWMRIAQTFSKAKAELATPYFKNLYRQTGFSKSTAYKLVTVAESPRIKQHEARLRHVEGWSVLHAIAVLTDEQFQRFEKEALLAKDRPRITRAAVGRFSQAKKDKSTWRLFATVRVDIAKINDLDRDALEKALAALRDIAHIECVQTEVIEKTDALNDAKASTAYQKTKKKEIRKAFDAAVRARKREIERERFSAIRNPIKRHQAVNKFFDKNVASKEEREFDLADDPRSAFERLEGEEYPEAKIEEAAMAAAAATMPDSTPRPPDAAEIERQRKAVDWYRALNSPRRASKDRYARHRFGGDAPKMGAPDGKFDTAALLGE